MPTIFDTAAGAVGSATNALNTTVTPGAIGTSMNGYFNKYITSVLDNALGRNRVEMNKTLSGIGSNAAQVGAYGGSRQGVLEGTAIGEYGKNSDELIASLMSQGFDTSAALGMQELGLMQSGASGLLNAGSTGFGMGQQAIGNQQAAGTQQQQLLQAILSGASGQFDSYTAQPTNILSTLLAALSGNPLGGNSSTSKSFQPGLFNYLSMASGVGGAGK